LSKKCASKKFENRLIFVKDVDYYKVGRFLRHSVYPKASVWLRVAERKRLSHTLPHTQRWHCYRIL